MLDFKKKEKQTKIQKIEWHKTVDHDKGDKIPLMKTDKFIWRTPTIMQNQKSSQQKKKNQKACKQQITKPDQSEQFQLLGSNTACVHVGNKIFSACFFMNKLTVNVLYYFLFFVDRNYLGYVHIFRFIKTSIAI